jgi:rhamnogalacturonan endolyase
MSKIEAGRRRRTGVTFFWAVVLPSLVLSAAPPARNMETLTRALTAVPGGGGKTFLSWRLLGTDPGSTTFNVYRSAPGGASAKLNSVPLAVTNFIDPAPSQGATYTVRAVIDGTELPAESAIVFTKPYLSIPLKTPAGYTPNDASAADLDGDGDYEIILHQAGRGRDNSQAGPTDPPILQAYKLDGTLLWQVNLGRNIREGAHYTQFLAYDLDSDGRAELLCKTADGTVDGAGNVIGDPKADHVNDRGYVLAGPEFLTCFDGLTGRAVSTVPYFPPRHPKKHDPTADELKAVWGDGYGNRCDRFLACVAYLDGVHPSAVFCRGYYTRTVLAAYDMKDGKLTPRWVFDSSAPGNQKYAGQGNHSLAVADVDNDGRDEIVYGALTIDDNGKPLYSTGLGHGDAAHLSDLDPARPGLEYFKIQERFGDAGAHMVDARTGEVLWRKPSMKAATTGGDKGEGPGRGVCFDVDPRHPGAESWARGAGVRGLWGARGNVIGDATPDSCNSAVWWDGDLLRELLDRNRVSKWNWEKQVTDRLVTFDGASSNNGTKATAALSADLLGDWREEVILRSDDNAELRLYTTTVPTGHRLYTLMHNPAYRLSIAWQNVGYNQPPHPDYYIGPDMSAPPRPNIRLVPLPSSANP